MRELDTEAIREQILEGLIEVRGVDRDEIDRAVAERGGDLRIDSKEGEAICVIVEDALGLGDLVRPSDLQPETMSTISSLTRLFEKRVAESLAADGKDAA